MEEGAFRKKQKCGGGDYLKVLSRPEGTPLEMELGAPSMPTNNAQV